MFTDKDLASLISKGITADQIAAQVAQFKKGIPFTKLSRACTINDGIVVLTPPEQSDSIAIFEKAASAGRVTKFVPASGAASRMFKSLLVCQERSRAQATGTPKDDLNEHEQRSLDRFLQELHKFAFYHEIRNGLNQKELDIDVLRSKGEESPILDFLLTQQGMNYSALPKGLHTFHQYGDQARTPLEEHLVEAVLYAQDGQGRARVHFTVSPEHESAVKSHFQKVQTCYAPSGGTFDVTFSTQKPSTDTISVNLDNQLFRTKEGNLHFRPGGHGALLENIIDLQGDIILIKNIDNVVPDHLKEETVLWKKILGGYLISLQDTVFAYLQSFAEKAVSPSFMKEVATFTRKVLCRDLPALFDQWNSEKQLEFLVGSLNRPLRVCGMVKNIGDPGGGPFWVEQTNGLLSLQIVESAQVDFNNPEQKALFSTSTYFNPVDLICGVRDCRGDAFDLRQFVDPEGGFITRKSHEGRELKALELPGLWNGGMAFWNTVFVEVPRSTFNPAKTVFDLLKPEHQPQQRFPDE